MSRLASAAEPERLSMILRAQARSRHGPHWALWWPLMAVMSSIYVLVVLATWAYIEVRRGTDAPGWRFLLPHLPAPLAPRRTSSSRPSSPTRTRRRR